MNDSSKLSRREELAASLGIVGTDGSRLAALASSKLSRWLVGAAILMVFSSLGLYLVVLQDRPEAYDNAAYLLEANRISENGGLASFPRMILDGKWEQGNQHPLYILAITPFADFDFDFMISAQLVNLFFGTLAVLAGYLIALRFYNHIVATIAATGFALTQLFIKWSTLVACESLLVLFSILAITAILIGFRDHRYWIAAGMFVGLAYLTKVTALLLLPGFFIAVLLHLRARAFRTREVYLFVVMFLVGCSPLLISNAIVHGSPLYNNNIDNLTDPGAGIVYREISLERGSMIRVYGVAETKEQLGDSVAFSLGEIAGLAAGVAQRLPVEFTMFLENFTPWPLHTGPTMMRWARGYLGCSSSVCSESPSPARVPICC